MYRLSGQVGRASGLLSEDRWFDSCFGQMFFSKKFLGGGPKGAPRGAPKITFAEIRDFVSVGID